MNYTSDEQRIRDAEGDVTWAERAVADAEARLKRASSNPAERAMASQAISNARSMLHTAEDALAQARKEAGK